MGSDTPETWNIQILKGLEFNLFFIFQVSGVSEPMFRAGYQIVKTEGAMALYNGLLPSLIRTFPATGALFCALEYSKKIMHDLF